MGPFISKRIVSATGAIGWMGLIFYLSSISATGLEPGTQDLEPVAAAMAYWQAEYGSAIGHVYLYSVLSVLIQAAFWSWGLGFRVQWVIAAAVAATLFGISDEYHQSFVMGRSATVMDGLIDSLAAIVSAILLWFLVKRIVIGRREFLLPENVPGHESDGENGEQERRSPGIVSGQNPT